MDKKLNDLSKCIQFSLDVMNKLEVRKELTIEQKILLSIYRKLIEQIDGNFILADHQLRSPSIVMTRSALETYLSLKYILQVKKFIKDRALCYYVGYLKNQKIVYNKMLSHPSTKATFSTESFKNKVDNIDQLLKSPNFKRILKQWEVTKRFLNKKFNNTHEPKWYSLFRGPTSIKVLVDRLEDIQIYTYYELLSLEAHGYEALNGLNHSDIINGPFSFKPIRNSENLDNFAEIARVLCTSATSEIIKYMSLDLKDDFTKLMEEIGVIKQDYSDIIAKIQFK